MEKKNRNLERRVILQEDANMPVEALGIDMEDWISFRFDLMDAKESPVDTVMWDMGFAEDSFATWTGSSLLPPVNHEGYNRWFTRGIDCVKKLVEETRKRGMEAIWNHRVCPVDFPVPYAVQCPFDSPLRNNYLKSQHPGWINECWWPRGLWNLASRGLRKHKLKYFRELMTRYEFDGLELDFARHTPCLPQGREWENREHVTSFIRQTRKLLCELEAAGNKTLTLGARVAENVEGCHADGFEVEKWIEEELIDFLLLGGRTSRVALDEFKSLCKDKYVNIYPSFDGFHAGDGYFSPPVEYYRGVFSNFLFQGADGISLFNWTCARETKYRELNLPAESRCPSQETALCEAGGLEKMKGKRKIYAVERRGGYPWAGTYLYRNDNKPLPLKLKPGESACLPVYIYERFSAGAYAARLEAVMFNGSDKTRVTIRVNGKKLEMESSDTSWKDGQIYGDGKQATSGNYRAYVIDPEQKLLKLSFTLPVNFLSAGENKIGISLLKADTAVTIEKLEITVFRG
ncbi:MAG TPA: hypothetical protein PKN36_04120 [bacterium]|nr:hypothetical protein [bacterium]